MNGHGVSVLRSSLKDMGRMTRLEAENAFRWWVKPLKILGVLVIVAFVAGVLVGITCEREKFVVEQIDSRPMDMKEASDYATVFSDGQMTTRFTYRLRGEKTSSFDNRGLRRKYHVLIFITTYDKPNQKVHIFTNVLPAEGEFGIEYRGR